MPLIESLLFEAVKEIVFSAISKRVDYETEKFFIKRKIESRVEDSIAQVLEQLVPFFESERIQESQQTLLINTISHELSDLLKNPREFFVASLDGQKIFDRRYESGILPQLIREEGIGDLYARIFPQIANLLCAYPLAVEQWKIEGFREGFQRLDEIAATLGNVVKKLDFLASKETSTADTLLLRVRQFLIQRVEFQLDLTGLRGDRPDAVPLEKCFIMPNFIWVSKQNKNNISVRGTANELYDYLVGKSTRVLIVGAPGSGKSTWSRWFQRQQLTSEIPKVAVLIKLRDLIKNDLLPSHQQIIRDAVGTHLREEINPIVVRDWCKSGLISFILDGFDEIPPTKRDDVLAWILDLSVVVENAGLILTTRSLTTSHLETIYTHWNHGHWELLPFDEKQITNYIINWYANAPLLSDKKRSVDASKLAIRWVGDLTLRPLVGTPLMLATILMVHHMDGELPRGRSKLYERYINGMLGLWDSRWGVPSAIDLSLDLKKRILTKLAIHLHIAEIEQLGDNEIQLLLDNILPVVGCVHPTSIVLDYLQERTGLLVGPGTWSFVHKNVGEFLVAAAICDGDQMDDAGQRLDRLRLFKERHNDRWNAVLFFWAGLTTPRDLQSFIEQVESEPGDDDFSLAISLIYDQLQPLRLTDSWKCDIFLSLLKRGFKKADTKTVFIYGACPLGITENVVECQFVDLKISGKDQFYKCIWECLEACKINWQQGSSCHESLMFYVWSYFSCISGNIEDLEWSYSKQNMNLKIPENWIMLSISWKIDREFQILDGKIHFNQYIDILDHNVPEHAGKIIFLLLWKFIEYYGYIIGDGGGDILVSNILSKILRMLYLTKNFQVNIQWLIYSREFWSKNRIKVFDLLDEFLLTLDKVVQKKCVQDEDLVSTVRIYINELRVRRETLVIKKITDKE